MFSILNCLGPFRIKRLDPSLIGDRKKRFKEEMGIVKDKVPLSRLRKGLIKLFWAN